MQNCDSTYFTLVDYFTRASEIENNKKKPRGDDYNNTTQTRQTYNVPQFWS